MLWQRGVLLICGPVHYLQDELTGSASNALLLGVIQPLEHPYQNSRLGIHGAAVCVFAELMCVKV